MTSSDEYDSYPRILPDPARVQRRGKDLERFLNLWRLALFAAVVAMLALARLGGVMTQPDETYSIWVLGSSLAAALLFQLYLAWLPWRQTWGIGVVLADLGVVVALLAGFLFVDRALAATNSQTAFLGYFVVVAFAGLRSDARVARVLAVAVPLSYALIVFLAVAWRQVHLAPVDADLGSFGWTTQLIRFVLVTAATWITQYDAALGARDRAQAQRDPLTGVYNRRYLEEFLAREVPRARRRQRPLSALLVDVDGFKAFNDTYGHLAGDRMLASIAASLAAAVRAGDVVARYGGDEFVIVLPGAAGETARRIARELARAVPSEVRLSAGVGCLGADVDTGEKLLAAADAHLLRAKQAGGDLVLA